MISDAVHLRFVLIPAVLFSCGWVGTVATASESKTVRDALWIWAHYEGSYNGAWGLPANSSITPIEAARSMGLQNMILIRYNGRPKPPFDAYAAPLRDMKQLMWSVVGTGSGSGRLDKQREHVFDLAAKMPNISGLFMDDFFNFDKPGQPLSPSARAEDLKQLRKRLTIGGRKLDLGVTLYTHQLDHRITPYLEYCDIVSLWTTDSADLAHLEENFAKLQTLMPGKRVLLGLYMWDFSGGGKPMPLERMKRQCRLALQWLHEGRIEGMIFLGSNICNLNLEAVDWTRSWIAEVGGQPLKNSR
jgi:hypothetical protein